MIKAGPYLLLFFLGSHILHAQVGKEYLRDAVLFSMQSQFGSARSISFGNAGVAGRNESSYSFLNPAVISTFTKSELGLTIGVGNQRITSDFSGNEERYSQGDFFLNHVGLVFNIQVPENSDIPFEKHNFAITVNKVGDFSSRVNFSGENELNGLSDYFIQESTGFNSLFLDGSNSLLGLGFQNFLFDVDATQCQSYDCDQYTRVFPMQALVQEGEIVQLGNQYQWDLSYGAAFSSGFSAGIKLGLSTLRYEEEIRFSETQIDQNEGEYSGSTLRTERELSGSGFNLGFGMLYEPNKNFAVGLGFSSGTTYDIRENSMDALETNYLGLVWTNPFAPQVTDTLYSLSGSTRLRENKYKFKLPWRLSLGTKIEFGLYHRFNIDVDYVPYSRVSYEFDNSNFDRIWARYSGDLENSFNLRVGYRILMGPVNIGAGYRYYGNPASSESMIDATEHIFSLGIGSDDEEHDNWFLWQLTVDATNTSEDIYPYYVAGQDMPEVGLKTFRLRAFLSATIFF